MSKVLIEEQTLEDIGDAIRGKNGLSTTYKPSGMPVAIANIPNIYAAGDEGKVVSSGALVSQTPRTVLSNGTYDTTLNNSVVVNVPGGSSTARQYLIDPDVLDKFDNFSLEGYRYATVSGMYPYCEHIYRNTSGSDVVLREGFHVCPPTSESMFDGNLCHSISYPARSNITYGSNTSYEDYYLSTLIFLYPIPPGAFEKIYMTAKATAPTHANTTYQDKEFRLVIIEEEHLSDCQNNDGWFTNTKNIYYITRSSWSASQIEGQTGISISTNNSSTLNEQTVEIEIPSSSSNLYIGLLGWQCEIFIRSLYLE